MVNLELSANNICFSYIPGKTVLHDVSLTIKAGEILFLLGRNGGGKTTLLSCLAGLLHPDSGEIRIDNHSLDSFSAAERAQRVGYIPQIHTPAFSYTVNEMVMMGRAPHLKWLAVPTKEDSRIVEECLEQVGISDLRDRPYTEISGGERQLVLIARGLAQRCHILLMDEPTAHLDLSNQFHVMEIIQKLTHQGLSFMISSHAPNDALAYADQVLLLSGGWVTDYGSPKDILTETSLSEVYGIQTEVIFDPNKEGLIPRAVVPRLPAAIEPESIREFNSPLGEIFTKSKQTPQIIVVTGLSGAGKTSWCLRLDKVAREKGMTVRGIVSPGIFNNDSKVRIKIKNLENGEEKVLATLRGEKVSGISTPRWQFNPESLSWANDILKNIGGSDLLIIDELGPLEFLRGEGLVAGLSLLDSRQFRVACVVVRSSLLPKVLQRWPESTVVSGNMQKQSESNLNMFVGGDNR